MSNRTQIWSSGGGVQSSAIAALICMGELKPELAVIVDTEREVSTTWDYMDKWVKPALDKAGCELIRVKKSDYATVDLYRNDDILIPAFTVQSGEVGKLPTYCSNEWKQRVMRRWAVEQTDSKEFDVWIGYSIDELDRVRTLIGKWQNSYPLIERRMTRGDCIALVERMGWPTPPRSACYMCPNRPHSEWKEMKETSPRDFQDAIAFQGEIQKEDEDLRLHVSGQNLEDVDFDDNQKDMFSGRCTNGMCFV